MKKRRILLPILLLSTFILGGCNFGKKSSENNDQTTYGVEIKNKAELEGEWYVGGTRNLSLALTPEANALEALGEGTLTVTSSDPAVVTVTGLGLKGMKAGKATIEVAYHGAKASVDATILDGSAIGRYGAAHAGDANDPLDNEDALLVAKHAKYEGESYYVRGEVHHFYHSPGERTDGVVSYFLTPAAGQTEMFEVYKTLKENKGKLTDDEIWKTGIATAYGTFTEYNGQYETSSATFVSCTGGNKPEARTNVNKTFAEALADGKACYDGDNTYNYYVFDAYVTKKSGSNYFLTATQGEAIADEKENTIEIFNAAADGLADKLLKNAKVTVRMVVKNYHGQAENLFALAATDVTVLIDGTDWNAPTDKYYAIVDSPVVGTKYRFGMNTKSGSIMYSTGAVAGNYGGTTDNYAEAPQFELVEVTGGYNVKITFSDSSVKFMNVVVSGNYTNVKFEDDATTVFTYNTDYKTLIVATSGHTDSGKDGDYFLGTYSTYSTISCSALSYLSPSNYDVSQFPCHFWAEFDRPAATGIEIDPSAPFHLEQGETQQMTATILPEHAAGTVVWSVSPTDKGVSISETGLVTVAADATIDAVVTVTAALQGKAFSASVAITVDAASGGGGGGGSSYTLDFTAKTANHNSYSDEWTYGDASLAGAANNNGGWAFVKFGPKSATISNAGYLGTYAKINNALSFSVSTVTINLVGKCYNQDDEKANVHIEAYSDSGFTSKVAETTSQYVPAIATNEGTDTMTFTFAAPAANRYYKVVFDITNTTTYNGVAAVASIVFAE